MTPFIRRAHRAGIRSSLVLGLLVGGMAVPAHAAASETFTVHSEFDLDGIVVEGCEEPVLMEGSLRETFHVTENASGGITLMIVTRPVAVSGTGLVSGQMYRGTGVTLQPTHMSEVPDGTNTVQHTTSTLVDRTKLVGTGGELTLDIRTVFHITKVDAVPVVAWDRTSITCT